MAAFFMVFPVCAGLSVSEAVTHHLYQQSPLQQAGNYSQTRPLELLFRHDRLCVQPVHPDGFHAGAIP